MVYATFKSCCYMQEAWRIYFCRLWMALKTSLMRGRVILKTAVCLQQTFKNDGLLPFRRHVAVFSIHRRLRRRHFAGCLPECQWGAAISRRCHAYRCFVWVHTFLLKSTDPIVNRVYVWMFDGSRSGKTNSSVFCSSSSNWTVSRCTLVAF